MWVTFIPQGYHATLEPRQYQPPMVGKVRVQRPESSSAGYDYSGVTVYAPCLFQNREAVTGFTEGMQPLRLMLTPSRKR